MEIKEKITADNCREIMNEVRIEKRLTHQESAWVTILEYCRQNGMEKEVPYSGLELVIRFIESKIK